MPWLAGTALLHSAVVMEKRNALKVWTILLAILTFSLSLIGTFLVRSGVLTSVHTFANDPTRGVFILAILVLFIGGSLALFAWRAPLLKQGGLFAPISREGALVFNNLFLTTACATVFVGTLYPLALEALTGEKISVGAPFFNLTFGPLFVPLLIAVPFGPLLAWKRGDLYGRRAAADGGVRRRHGRRSRRSSRSKARQSVLAPFGVGLALFVMAGAITDIAERTGLLRPAARDRRRGARRAAALGLGHGAWRISAWRHAARHHRRGHLGQRADRRAEAGADGFAISGYDLTFDGTTQRNGPNYRELAAKFTVRNGGARSASWSRPSAPSRRATTTTNEAALHDARRQPALPLARRHQCRTARSRSGSITSRWCC